MQSTKQSVFVNGAADKPVIVAFDAEGQSSDGGVLLLKSLDDGLGLTRSLLSCLTDRRDPSRISHSFPTLFRQRVFGIALGYSDCNDAERVGNDPCLKLACDRSPLDPDDALGSQPTLSRFENAHGGRELVHMQRKLEQDVILRLSRRHRKTKTVCIDLDPTCDPTHGQQAFSFFHGFYGTSCYLPQLGFLSFDDGPEQYLFHARLRPGNARCSRGVIPLLRRIVPDLRKRFPNAKIRVRLDGGFAHPRLFDVLDELKVQYIVGLPSNSALLKRVESIQECCRVISNCTGERESFFDDFAYKAGSWKSARRVVYKAEIVHYGNRPARDNQRFVVTNLRHSPENVYQIYRERGDVENRIKELKYLDSDRTSCSSFLANQFRLLTCATAYVLYQELRWRLRKTPAARSQVSRLQIMLMKIGTRVVESVRRIVLHFPIGHAWRDLWLRVARQLGAQPT